MIIFFSLKNHYVWLANVTVTAFRLHWNIFTISRLAYFVHFSVEWIASHKYEICHDQKQREMYVFINTVATELNGDKCLRRKMCISKYTFRQWKAIYRLSCAFSGHKDEVPTPTGDTVCLSLPCRQHRCISRAILVHNVWRVACWLVDL